MKMAKKKNSKYLIERDLKNPTYNKCEMDLIEAMAKMHQVLTTLAKKGYTNKNLVDLIDISNLINILTANYMCAELRLPLEIIDESYDRIYNSINNV